ncbi:kinetochore-associated protein KNL-2 homolog [Lycium ferocissimum]|uniref:kinetochore-associated protein KNL-2 homolog n=1 Tax=Lycium ferocissimum TaxID=112874 RepID=UPI002815FFCD|nr:kinetochore-associated protein KNL-2 homolog [Lycium ferocissimum]
MASTSTQRVNKNESCEPKSNNYSTKSCFQPTVCLKDWWLIRAEKDSQGRTLAVAGLTSREGQALRVFSSAPILKTNDVCNLETIDGICVILKGFINKSRSEENGFSSEVVEQFLLGFPPQWEAFIEKFLRRKSKGKAAASDALGFEEPSVYSGKVKYLKKIDQKDHLEATDEKIQDHLEATDEKIQDHNGEKDFEIEDNLKTDNQNDGEVASEVIVRKTRSSNKLYTNTSTGIAKEQTADNHHNGKKDCELEDNLKRDNQNDGEVASEVIVRKTRSSNKLNYTNTSTGIAKEQTADDYHNGRKDYEVEDNLKRDNQNDGEVASEVIVRKTRSSNKLYTNTSTGIAKEQTADNHHNGKMDYEVEDNLKRDNQNDGEVASEVIVQKTRSSNKLNYKNTSTGIAKEQSADDSRTTQLKSGSASAKNAKRKLTYGSPQQGKEAVPPISTEPLSFSRSRSGRALLPRMAFWRNQMAIYDADHQVTGVKQGDPDLDNLSRVSRSEPSRKRRQIR